MCEHTSFTCHSSHTFASFSIGPVLGPKPYSKGDVECIYGHLDVCFTLLKKSKFICRIWDPLVVEVN